MRKSNKQKLIDEILKLNFTPLQAIKYMKRSMMKRIGPDVMKDWEWDLERLRYYQESDLQEVIDDLKNVE